MTGGLAEMLEILGRAGIGGEDAEHAAIRHVAHRLARLQDRQRAFEPRGVEDDRLSHRSACHQGRLKSVPSSPRPSDRKSTRLNSSHMSISYAVFCLKKKKKKKTPNQINK